MNSDADQKGCFIFNSSVNCKKQHYNNPHTMKKIYKGILFWASLIFASVILQSCCTNDITIIGSGEIFAIQLDNHRQDTIRNEFNITLLVELEFASNLTEVGFISTANALQCSDNYVNYFLEDTFKLSCDKAFFWNGVRIDPGLNILNLVGITSDISKELGNISIQFTSEFLDVSEFEVGFHTFQIEIETSDQIKIKNEVSSFLDFK